MSEDPVLVGKCYCGAVEIKALVPPDAKAICHWYVAPCMKSQCMCGVRDEMI
jgi:hypothetical protein